MSKIRCRPSIVVTRNVNASAVSDQQVEAPVGERVPAEDAPDGSRHSRAATMCSSEIVMSPIVVATASP